jgi:NAD(P)-dependent dehydrogenase (short-subunit alcohol dehydrogenase family)
MCRVRAFSKGRVEPIVRTGPTPEGQPVTNENATSSASKIALITGGSRGIGRSTVLHLAERGVDSIFTYRENQAEAAKVIAGVEAQGRRAIALPLDTGVSGSFDAFVERARAAIGELGATRFDYLVNNAGQSLHKAFDQTTEAELDAIYNVHFKGVYLLTQKLLPLIADGGRIVNISSGLARVSMPGSSAYGAMKGAVEVLTRYMAAELGPRGIAVNTVAPGAVATDFSGGMVRDTPELAQRISSMTALGRVGQPDDLGAMISALLSDANRWISGQRIEVSGGMLV